MISLSLRKHVALGRGALILGAYSAWIAFFKLLVLTFLTYFLLNSSDHKIRYEEVNEAFGATELGIMGLSALLFVGALRAMNPLTSTTFPEIFTPLRFEKKFLPGFAQGAVMAAGVILAFVLSGTYKYLGFFVQFEETPLAIGNVLLRTLSLIGLVYCEEFIFRKKILGHLLRWRTSRPGLPLGSDLAVATVVSLLYCAVKALQFELGVMHWMTLFLVSLSLSLRALGEKDFVEGAGFWAAILIVFHPLLSLPVFGNEFSGIMLVKFQALPSASDADNITDATLRFLSGGPGGPISAFAFQLLLAFDIARRLLPGSSASRPSPSRR